MSSGDDESQGRMLGTGAAGAESHRAGRSVESARPPVLNNHALVLWTILYLYSVANSTPAWHDICMALLLSRCNSSASCQLILNELHSRILYKRQQSDNDDVKPPDA